MLGKKIVTELDTLIKIAQKQDYKINAITFDNLYVSLSSSDKTEDTLSEMRQYLIARDVEVVDDGVELEEEDTSYKLNHIRPFDPSKIDIVMQTMTIDGLIKRIVHDEVNLKTDFQRKGGLWTNKQKSQLIESLLLKIPLPAFYFDGAQEDNWLIIDGLQRISTLKEFVIDKTLKLTGLEFFNDLEGLGYDDLPRTFVRRIEETDIIAFKVRKGTPVNVKYNIFKRINTGGLELTPQEIRHALFFGTATKICQEFSRIEEFKKATSYSIKEVRMMDQEFVLRYIACCIYGTDKYEGVPDNFLNGAMEYLNTVKEEEIQEIRAQFIRVMERAYHVFGKYAFRKLAADNLRRPINKAIYEAWCKCLYKLSDDEYKQLAKRKETLFSEFLRLCEDELFLSMIKASDKKSYLFRFDMVWDLTRRVLDD